MQDIDYDREDLIKARRLEEKKLKELLKGKFIWRSKHLNTTDERFNQGNKRNPIIKKTISEPKPITNNSYKMKAEKITKMKRQHGHI